MEAAKFDIHKLVRPNILNMKAYSSARSEFSGEANTWLDANEHPTPSDLNRYPDPLQVKVKEKISNIYAVPTANIFLGNGSDEAIDLILRIFCRPGKDRIITLPPTYGMYAVSAAIQDVAISEINLDENFQPDVDRILNTATELDKVLFICSPNNPTGNLMYSAEMERLVASFGGLVVIDQAYIDFCPEFSVASWVARFPNLIVLQTLSKAWGKAGLRLGMAFAQPDVIDLLNKVKAPYNINSLTQKRVLDILEGDAQMKKEVRKINQNKEKLLFSLQKMLSDNKLVLKIYPSDANFLLVKFTEARSIYKYLLNLGIVVRDRSSQMGCENCLRLTVGTKAENTQLINALNSYSIGQ